MNYVYLSLGSNLDDRMENLRKAKTHIKQKIGNIIRKSELYETESWGFATGKNFINQVILIETSMSPDKLLSGTQKIEKDLGRTEKTTSEYQSRVIDIDILFFNNHIIKNGDLTVPHPLIQERKFVLVPMRDIALDYVHPELLQSIGHLNNICKDRSKVFLLKDHDHAI